MAMKTSVPRCKFIESVGVEIECGIPTSEAARQLELFERVNDRFSWGTDGSVSVSGCWQSNAELRYWSPVSEWKGFVSVLRWLWEEIGIRQNSSCGNHVHIRLKSDYTNILVSPEFVRYFQRSYLHFARKQHDVGKYLARIRSTFCAFYSYRNLEQQVLENYHAMGSRYRSINFMSLSESQRTIEFRIMPFASGFEEHLRMVLFIVRVVERFCAQFCRGKRELSCSEVRISHFNSYLPSTRFVRLWDSNNIENRTVEVIMPQLSGDVIVEITTTLQRRDER